MFYEFCPYTSFAGEENKKQKSPPKNEIKKKEKKKETNGPLGGRMRARREVGNHKSNQIK